MNKKRVYVGLDAGDTKYHGAALSKGNSSLLNFQQCGRCGAGGREGKQEWLSVASSAPSGPGRQRLNIHVSFNPSSAFTLLDWARASP